MGFLPILTHSCTSIDSEFPGYYDDTEIIPLSLNQQKNTVDLRNF